jgi:small neutral amino acid transporter SnatA (MarC family)
VASRLMGLVLAATAVEFLAKGLAGLFPSLAR